MELEWDQRKADANLRKHGVDFADAGTVLHDDHAITIPDEESGEKRFAGRARVISARSATPRERRQYEEAR